MKNYKAVIALLLALAITVSFAACKAKNDADDISSTGGNAEAVTVTDENGEVVTDENGIPVTVEFDAKAHANLGDKEKTSSQSGDTTKPSDSKSQTKKDEPLSKVKNPNSVKKLNVSAVTENSLTLSWDAVYCNFYELEYKHKEADRWESVDDNLKATSIDLTGLESMTEYSFRIRAVIKHKAGNSESAWTEANAKTKEQNLNRKIKIYVTLPTQNKDSDTLILSITEEGKGKKKLTEIPVQYDGSTVTYVTEDKYKGVVTVEAKLKNADAVQSVKTDKDYCEIEITGLGIDMLIGEDD